MGDTVRIAMSPYDLTRGRIVWRGKYVFNDEKSNDQNSFNNNEKSANQNLFEENETKNLNNNNSQEVVYPENGGEFNES